MEKNVGGSERKARIVIGAVLAAIGVAGYAGLARVAMGPVPQATLSIALVAAGVAVLVTGLTRKCMINRVMGRNSN